MDYYNMGPGPGIDAFFAGQKHASEQAQAQAQIQAQLLQQQQLQQQMQQSQQRFPFELQQLQQKQQLFPFELQQLQQNLRNAQLTGQRTEGQLSEDEIKRRQESADRFFKYLEERDPDDIQGAQLYSGVPPQFAQKYATLPPAQREQVIKRWQERRTAPERAKAEFESQLKQKEIAAGKQADYAKAEMQKRADLERALSVQRLKNEQALAVAQRKVSQMKNQSFQQRATALMNEAMQLRGTPARSPEEQEAKQARLAELTQEIDQMVLLDFQHTVAATQQRQAGQPDIGQLGGGQIPTMPAPQPQVPSQMRQPQPSQYVPQQVYKGRTGTYQYLGGDPKNPASWKKVGP